MTGHRRYSPARCCCRQCVCRCDRPGPSEPLPLLLMACRYYAEQHSSTDSFCCVTGIAVYLSLIPITVGMRRLDLVAIACAAAAMCTTLLILSRRKREWYLRRRHAVLLVQ